MKPVPLVGIGLIIVGVLALAYQGFTYTTREKIIDLGPIKASVAGYLTHPAGGSDRRAATARARVRHVSHTRSSVIPAHTRQ